MKDILCDYCKKVIKCNPKRIWCEPKNRTDATCICSTCYLKDFSIQILQRFLNRTYFKNVEWNEDEWFYNHWNLKPKEWKKKIMIELLCR